MMNNVTIPSSDKLQIIVAGGGTGGHIFPAIAIANAIKARLPLCEILFVGAKGKMEMEKVPQAGYQIEGLTIAGYNRSNIIKNITLPFKIVKSFYEVSQIFKNFTPTLVIGVGGYSSFPVLRYAQARNIPTFIHESNSFAGRSNILLGKKATKIFTACTGMEAFFPPEKIVVTGNPVRKNIVDKNASKELALNFFGLSQNKKTILSLGGSLGAKSINDAVAANLKLFAENNLQLIWQTGKPFSLKAAELTKGFTNVFATDFIMQMDYAYTAADLIISRSGAMAIAEICVAQKPAVLVPYPYAAEDHQTSNAMALVKQNAAIMVKDADAGTTLVNTIIGLAKDDVLQQNMRHSIAKLANTNSDETIANEIILTLQNNLN